jgi:hypothetical protein
MTISDYCVCSKVDLVINLKKEDSLFTKTVKEFFERLFAGFRPVSLLSEEMKQNEHCRSVRFQKIQRRPEGRKMDIRDRQTKGDRKRLTRSYLMDLTFTSRRDHRY